MARSEKSRYLAAAGVVAVLLSSGCAMVTGEQPADVVVIGADLELSGDDAELGNVYLGALQLRVEQVNEQGLLRGNRRLTLEVRDNRSDPATAANNLADLASDPAISAIVSGTCAQCLVDATQAINEAAVPTISLAAADEVVTPVVDKPYLFKLSADSVDTAGLIGRELADVESVGLVTTDDLYGEGGRSEMAEVDDGSDEFEIVVDEKVTAGEDSLAAAADQVANYQSEALPPLGEEPSLGPDAVVVWAPSPIAEEFAVSLRDTGYEGPLYLDAAAADELFITGGTGDALSGATLIFTDTLVVDDQIATSPAKVARKTWFRDYSARYGTYHAFSSFAADSIDLVVEAVNQLNSTDRERIRDAFERTEMDGLSGPLRMTPDDHSALTSLSLTTLVARGDRWQPAN